MKKQTIKAMVVSAKGPKVCTGRELAEALANVELSETEAKAWRRDLIIARRRLKLPVDKGAAG